MQKRPLISIITVCFNAAAFIEKTIQSINEQTYKDFEYLVIDGQSTDSTLHIVKQYSHLVTTLISEPDHGIYDAMNKGAALARGEWVVFLNAGDFLIDSNTLEIVARALETHNPDFLYGDYIWVTADERHLNKARPLNLMWQRISFSHQSLYARTQLLLSHPFNTKLNIAADYDFYYRMYRKKASFHYLEKVLSGVIHGGLSDTNFIQRTNQRFGIVLKYGADITRISVILYYLKYFYFAHYWTKFMRSDFALKLKKVKTELEIHWYNFKQLLGMGPCINHEEELISVVVPNYNNERYIFECLKSVLLQKHSNTEIIVVDDCSTDRSARLVKKIRDPRIRLLLNEKNIGVSATRNRGIMAARGKYVTTLDSDDIFVSQRKLHCEYTRLMEMSEKGDTNLVSFSNIQHINRDGKKTIIIGNDASIKEGYIFEGLLSRSIFIPRDFLAPKQLYIDAGLYDENLSLYEDWDLKLRMARIAQFVFSGCTGIGYRRHGTGLSAKPKKELQHWEECVRNRNMAFLTATPSEIGI